MKSQKSEGASESSLESVKMYALSDLPHKTTESGIRTFSFHPTLVVVCKLVSVTYPVCGCVCVCVRAYIPYGTHMRC